MRALHFVEPSSAALEIGMYQMVLEPLKSAATTILNETANPPYPRRSVEGHQDSSSPRWSDLNPFRHLEMESHVDGLEGQVVAVAW